MSFAFCPFYKLLLKENIKDRIINKINTIQINSNWANFDFCIKCEDIDVTSINYNDIIHQHDLWKSIAKLSIDLWIDYDYYRKFMFESLNDSKEYAERLENLGYKNNNGLWKSISKPNEEIVVRNVFVYCLHRLMSDEMTRNTNTNDKSLLIGDLVCDSNDKCIKDMNANDAKGKGDIETDVRDRNKVLVDSENNFDKWQCVLCKLWQIYDVLNCSACGNSIIKNGLWQCKKCTVINKCSDNTCNICAYKNDDLKLTEVKYQRTNDNDNDKILKRSNYVSKRKQWQCQHTNCGRYNNPNSEYCLQCQLKRNHSRLRGDRVERLWRGDHVCVDMLQLLPIQ